MGFKLYKKTSTPIDLRIKDYIERNRSPKVFKFMKAITRLANVEVIFLLVFVLSLLFIYRRDFVNGTSIILAAVFSSIASHGLKLIFRRSRPVKRKELNYIGYSFPSGHSTIGVCFYTVLFYILASIFALPLIIVSLGLLIGLIVAFSRIYLSAHWTLDVLFGIALGIMCSLWTIYLNIESFDAISPVLERLNILYLFG